ncbi:MAG: hypothetical protein AVDCRST_MAG02-4033, partial [uncultured Rubrobacteraceae bacterium]
AGAAQPRAAGLALGLRLVRRCVGLTQQVGRPDIRGIHGGIGHGYADAGGGRGLAAGQGDGQPRRLSLRRLPHHDVRQAIPESDERPGGAGGAGEERGRAVSPSHRACAARSRRPRPPDRV